MFLAQATVKHKPPPPCTIKTQTPAQKKAAKGEMELQNEEELSVAMVRKNLGSTDKDERESVGPIKTSNVRRHDNAITVFRPGFIQEAAHQIRGFLRTIFENISRTFTS